ncbi:hypothetical protein GGTG_12141 [Gaeumannomyces tritici R3-111a-1]|uniref:Uncharacterized protein n=1 Tax=Gaeumannomyces tritici (strain R3-111a-1) TaxID=644352 RepID=J3PF62_GAET3|nr:hypothetical protein GGTG_12141 [Gaeumannomyces tritici R3-111a-1]EJT69964.1 hypothetical protein GGTG_12141 [Gaeumannomyces tritici R3-111a-1]
MQKKRWCGVLSHGLFRGACSRGSLRCAVNCPGPSHVAPIDCVLVLDHGRDIHPLSVAVNSQPLNWPKSSGNHCSCTYFPLKIIRGGSETLMAEMHSINDVQVRSPGSFLCKCLASARPRTRPLPVLPSCKPPSSALYVFSGLIPATSGIRKCCHQFLITVIVAPLTRADSMRRPLPIRISG